MIVASMDVSRRFFIGGAASFGAFAGCRFFGCPDFRAGGTPKLKFGVLSDIHISHVGAGEKMSDRRNNLTFRHALEWFRSQDVDAVVIAGDLTNNGMDDQLLAVAEAWYSVFPGDRYPDGRPVEKIFVCGNHDFYGYLYGDHAARRYPDPKERRQHVLRADFKGWWEKTFNEEYARFYVKDVRGYRFLGAHWDDGTGMETGRGSTTFGVELAAHLAKRGREIDPAQPFFYVQHPHPKDTCYGSWAWGHDDGKATKCLSACPNAIAFSGHSHYSLTDERSVWQGAFTSVGAGSLRYTCLPYDERPPAGYENAAVEGKDAWRHNAVKLMGELSAGDCRQGMLWSVYDDCIAVRRREFLSDLDIGDDWVMPLPSAESKPFAFAARAKKLAAPSFAANAQLAVKRVKAKSRGGRSPDGKTVVAAEAKEAFQVVIPPAVADKTARLFELEVVAEAKGGARVVKFLMAEGFNHAPTHPKARTPNVCNFSLDELPKGEVRFVVTPMNCFHARGKSLVSRWVSV